MPTVKRFLLKNACYHIIMRGNQQQNVFVERNDYLVYLVLLKRFKRKYDLRLYAYCLMPNHVHLLGEINPPDSLSRFMHDLNRTYTLYFNHKYKKVGHLWQGRFKSMVIAKDEYLLECLNYIEMNPLKAGIIKVASEYLWSSYNSRVLSNRNNLIVDKLKVL